MRGSLPGLIEEAKGCRACHRYEHATQTVSGAGPKNARIVMVGEQPGDQEDLQGRGKRRIHQKPTALRVVCLGATAAQALLGRAFRVANFSSIRERSGFCPPPLGAPANARAGAQA